MGWISEDASGEHSCAKPTPSETENRYCGAVWECDDCKRRYGFGGRAMNGRGEVFNLWTDLPSVASGPTFFSDTFAGPSGLESDTAWPGLLVNLDGLDEDEAAEKLTAFLKGTP